MKTPQDILAEARQLTEFVGSNETGTSKLVRELADALEVATTTTTKSATRVEVYCANGHTMWGGPIDKVEIPADCGECEDPLDCWPPSIAVVHVVAVGDIAWCKTTDRQSGEKGSPMLVRIIKLTDATAICTSKLHPDAETRPDLPFGVNHSNITHRATQDEIVRELVTSVEAEQRCAIIFNEDRKKAWVERDAAIASAAAMRAALAKLFAMVKAAGDVEACRNLVLFAGEMVFAALGDTAGAELLARLDAMLVAIEKIWFLASPSPDDKYPITTEGLAQIRALCSAALDGKPGAPLDTFKQSEATKAALRALVDELNRGHASVNGALGAAMRLLDLPRPDGEPWEPAP